MLLDEVFPTYIFTPWPESCKAYFTDWEQHHKEGDNGVCSADYPARFVALDMDRIEVLADMMKAECTKLELLS